jgi:hypothetical protein
MARAISILILIFIGSAACKQSSDEGGSSVKSVEQEPANGPTPFGACIGQAQTNIMYADCATQHAKTIADCNMVHNVSEGNAKQINRDLCCEAVSNKDKKIPLQTCKTAPVK